MNVYDVLRQLLTEKTEEISISDSPIIDSYTDVVLNRGGDYSFDTGLLGLGWIVAYFVRTRYTDTDGDEILYDIDDAIYKLCIKEVVDNAYDVNRLLHFISFYQERMQYKSSAIFYRRFAHEECLKLLVDKIDSFIMKLSDDEFLKHIPCLVNVLCKYSYLKHSSIGGNLFEERIVGTTKRLVKNLDGCETLSDYSLDLTKLDFMLTHLNNPVLLKEHLKVQTLLKVIIDSSDRLFSLFNELKEHPLQANIFGELLPSITDNSLLYHFIANIKTVRTSVAQVLQD